MTRIPPTVGEPVRAKDGVIIPSYVRLSERPRERGMCVTGPLVRDPAGWYIEFRYAGCRTQYRSFFAFDEIGA